MPTEYDPKHADICFEKGGSDVWFWIEPNPPAQCLWLYTKTFELPLLYSGTLDEAMCRVREYLAHGWRIETEVVHRDFAELYVSIFGFDEHAHRLVKDFDPDPNSDDIVLIASGYEWTCPACHTENTTLVTLKRVTCRFCTKTFTVDPVDYVHAED